MIETRPWHGVALDAVVVLLLAVLAADGDGEPGLLLPLVLVTSPVLLRRRYPVPVLIWTNAVTYLFVLRLEPGLLPAAWMLASYSAAVRSRRAAVLTAAGTWPLAQAIVVHQGGMTPLQLVVIPLIVALPPCVLADAVRRRREWRAAFAEQQRRRAEAEAEARIAAERLTIARELHDVVAHGVTLMTVQAGIARLRSGGDDPLHEVVGTIEQTGRASLVEMRRLMGLLRGGDAEGLAPPPGLSDLGDLVAAASAAGLHTELTVRGTPGRLPPGADLAAYRIIQEALTNAVKHSSTRAATVTVTHEADGVRVRVRNAGADGPPGEGQGLAGMRERARLYGGTVDAGPVPPDGWQVEAWIPGTPAATAATGVMTTGTAVTGAATIEAASTDATSTETRSTETRSTGAAAPVGTTGTATSDPAAAGTAPPAATAAPACTAVAATPDVTPAPAPGRTTTATPTEDRP